MSTSRRLRLEPWDVALHMMRAARDPGLITAYLLVEARRAGVDPIDLSMHPSDVFSRQWRSLKRSVRSLVDALAAFPTEEFKTALAKAQTESATGPP